MSYYTHMKLIVIGSGGRDHAIARQLSLSSLVTEIICVPGNGGTHFENKCRNINPATYNGVDGLSTIDAMVAIAISEKCDMAVIGPEDP